MTPADTMRAAVEALEASIDNFPANVCHRNAIALLRSALEQGEPHACRWFNGKCMDCGRSWGAPRDEADLASIPPITPVEAGKVGVADGVPETPEARRQRLAKACGEVFGWDKPDGVKGTPE